jgi:hypothetical protein
MMRGADLKVPRFFYYIMKYVTPTFLIVILVAYIFKPAAGWETHLAAWSGGTEAPAWDWAGDGMIGMLLHKNLQLPPDAAPADVSFNEQLKFWRTVDRMVMIGTFVAFAGMVTVAWRKRAKPGEQPA